MSTAEKLLADFEDDVIELTLVPDVGGKFEVTVDDELVYSKLATGRHVEYEPDLGFPIRERL